MRVVGVLMPSHVPCTGVISNRLEYYRWDPRAVNDDEERGRARAVRAHIFTAGVAARWTGQQAAVLRELGLKKMVKC